MVPVPEGVGQAGEPARKARRAIVIHWPSVALAVLVLVAAGAVAVLLHTGDPAGDPPVPPVAGAVDPVSDQVVDDRARRLTDQLAAARATVLPGVTELRPGPLGAAPGAPLAFSTGVLVEAGGYLAQATFGPVEDAAVLLLEVRHRDPAAGRVGPLCSESEVDCVERTLGDGSVAAVSARTDEVTDQTVRVLTGVRPDGTVCQVTVYKVGREPGEPPLRADDLYRFATVFTY